MEAKLSINQAQWNQAERMLKGFSKGLPTAAARAVNRTLTTGRKIADQEIRKDHQISSAAVKSQIRLYRAAPRFGRTSGTLEIGHRSLTLYKFFRVKPKTPFHDLQRKPRGGAQASARKSTGYKVIPQSFVVRMKSGHVGLFTRTGSKTRSVEHWARTGRGGAKVHRGNYKSEGIRELYGPSPAGMARTADVYRPMEREMQDTLHKRFAHEMDNIIRRGR